MTLDELRKRELIELIESWKDEAQRHYHSSGETQRCATLNLCVVKLEDVVRRLFTGAVVLLVLVSTAQAQERPRLALPATVYALAATADVATTASCAHAGCHETNPVIAWLQPRGAAMMLTAGVALETAVAVYVGRVHPRFARVAFYSAAVVHATLAASNINQARAQRQCNATKPLGARC